MRLCIALAGAIALLLTAAVATGPAEAKKKGKSNVDLTLPGGAITPASPASDPGLTEFSTAVGKKFKGRKVRDVDVTVTLSGPTPPADPLAPLLGVLRAPDGASTVLWFDDDLTGAVAGPVTFTDEVFAEEFGGPPPAFPIPVFLYEPYQGSVQPQGKPLAVMDDGSARGTWRLQVFDFDTDPGAMLQSWRLQVKTGKAYAKKADKK